MKNILKADFYRLFISKSFYICTLVSAALFCLGICVMRWTYNMTASQGIEINFIYKDGLSYGMTAYMDGSIHMIICIFIAIFVTSEFSHGTMKNIVSKGFSKIYIFLSKLITMTVAAFIIVIVTAITGTVVTGIVIGEFGSLSGEFGSFVLKTTAIELYLFVALTALFLMVSITVKNLGAAIAIGVIGIVSFENVIFALIEILVDRKIKFSEFSLMYNTLFYRMNMEAGGSDYIRSLIVGAVFFLVSIVFGIFMFKKVDVK